MSNPVGQLVWDNELRLWGVLDAEGRVLLVLHPETAETEWGRSRLLRYTGCEAVPSPEEVATVKESLWPLFSI